MGRRRNANRCTSRPLRFKMYNKDSDISQISAFLQMLAVHNITYGEPSFARGNIEVPSGPYRQFHMREALLEMSQSCNTQRRYCN